MQSHAEQLGPHHSLCVHSPPQSLIGLSTNIRDSNEYSNIKNTRIFKYDKIRFDVKKLIIICRGSYGETLDVCTITPIEPAVVVSHVTLHTDTGKL